jgi:hypothetical protein
MRQHTDKREVWASQKIRNYTQLEQRDEPMVSPTKSIAVRMREKCKEFTTCLHPARGGHEGGG